MDELHYDYIKNKFENNSKVLFKGTDNLMYKIITEGVNKDFISDKEMLKFNNYLTK